MSQARQAGGSGLPGGLFCVPVLVKDNFDTLGMASAAGSATMLDNFAPRDAQQVCSVFCAVRPQSGRSSTIIIDLMQGPRSRSLAIMFGHFLRCKERDGGAHDCAPVLSRWRG